ncbi:MAG: YHS domain-containing (seleno)protein [Pseudomonadota bacterium]
MPHLAVILCCFFVLLSAPKVWAQEILNVTEEGVAIDGFDSVAYFKQGRPIKGRPEYSHTYKDHLWHFATAANRDAFADDPQAYAPQYNGFCAVAVSEGAAAEVDFINGWTIQNGRLFFNWSAAVRDRFLQDRDQRIREADRWWPEVHSDMKHGLRQIARHRDFPNLGISHPQQAPNDDSP